MTEYKKGTEHNSSVRINGMVHLLSNLSYSITYFNILSVNIMIFDSLFFLLVYCSPVLCEHRGGRKNLTWSEGSEKQFLDMSAKSRSINREGLDKGKDVLGQGNSLYKICTKALSMTRT